MKKKSDYLEKVKKNKHYLDNIKKIIDKRGLDKLSLADSIDPDFKIDEERLEFYEWIVEKYWELIIRLEKRLDNLIGLIKQNYEDVNLEEKLDTLIWFIKHLYSHVNLLESMIWSLKKKLNIKTDGRIGKTEEEKIVREANLSSEVEKTESYEFVIEQMLYKIDKLQEKKDSISHEIDKAIEDKDSLIQMLKLRKIKLAKMKKEEEKEKEETK